MIYRFSPFCLDTNTRELRTEAGAVNIQPRVYELLVLLVENKNIALKKDVIHEAIWPGQILTETALSRLIMKARKALDDSSDAPQYIKTVHGFGFQFIAPVSIEEPAHAQTQTTEPPVITSDNLPVGHVPQRSSNAAGDSSKRRALFRYRGAVVFALTLAFALGAFFYTHKEQTQVLDRERIAVLPMHNKVDSDALNWLSIGIPSLVSTMLEQSSMFTPIDVKKLHALAQQSPELSTLGLDLFEEVRSQLGADLVVFTTIEKQGELFVLSYSFHGDSTQAPTFKLTDGDPIELAVKLNEKILDRKRKLFEAKEVLPVASSGFVKEAYAKAKSLLISGETQKARDLLQVILNESPELFWPHYDFALTTRKLGQWQDAEAQLLELLKHPRLNQLKRAESKTRNVLGFVYYRQKQYDKALVQYEQAFTLAKANNDNELMAGIADNMGAIYWIRYEFDAARKWLTSAISERKRSGVPPTGHAYNMLGLLERDQGNMQASRTQFAYAAELFGEAGMIRDYTFCQINITTIDVHQGLYDEALTRLDNANAQFVQLKEKEAWSYLYQQYANAYLAKGQIADGQNFARMSEEQAADLNSEARVAIARFELAKVSIAQGNWDKASSYLKQFQSYEDEVWGPYLPYMQVALAQGDDEGWNRYKQLAEEDAINKGDRLYQLAIKVINSQYMAEQDNRADFEKETALILSDARYLNAGRILGEQIGLNAQYFMKWGESEKARTSLMELELLFPDWLITKTLTEQYRQSL